ncbi:hypothetical protein [Nocardia sp. NPDC057030]|uniref:hypothetical protein n=1 Tax=unclassified Nocardia TaxID=2637762 RepID=UPI0036321A21
MELPGYEGIYSGIAHLNVGLADRLLELNTHNRRVRIGKVAELARGFRSGDWQLNGEALKFDRLGRMIDGQHRCTAVQEVGRGAYPSVVIWGLEPSSQETMDQGLQRTAFEMLTLAGVDADVTLAATIRLLIRWREGLLFSAPRSARVTNTSVVSWGKDNPEAIARLRELARRGYRRVIGTPPSVAMTVAFVLDQIAPKTLEEFYSGLISPVGLPDGSPILALRSRLERIVITRLDLPEREVIGYYLSAWNAFREGRSMAMMQGPRGGKWTPETFPVPK